MQKITLIVCNSGDGSNHIQIVKSEKALEKVYELAENGDDRYASGDGLQTWELKFPDEFALEAWVKMNFYGYSDEDILEDV
jgi:hypothetical protein